MSVDVDTLLERAEAATREQDAAWQHYLAAYNREAGGEGDGDETNAAREAFEQAQATAHDAVTR